MSCVGRICSGGHVLCVAAGFLFAVCPLAIAQESAAPDPPAPAAPEAANPPADGSTPDGQAKPEAPPDGSPTTLPKDEPAPSASAPAKSPVRMSRPGTFDVNFLGTDVRLALRLLGTQGRKNIIATKEVKGTITADLYQVTFQEALEAVLRSGGFVHQEKGSFVYIMTPKQLENIEKSQRKVKVQVFRLAYVTAADAQTLIGPALSSDGRVEITPAAALGIAPSGTDTGGESYAADSILVVRDYEENLRRVGEILRDLDVKPQQVLIEVTLLRATLTENNALGVDFNTLAGIDFETMGSTSPGVQSLTTGTISGTALPNSTALSTLRTDFNSAIDAGGMTIGFIANEAAFFIRALEGVTDVTVLANPKLPVVNKMRGEIMVGNRDGYLTTTVTETIATQTVEFLETGTRLVVRPFIGRNGYIRMEIHPEDSSGSVVPVGNSVLPSETTTEVTTNVLVRDGHTIVIGGLFRERTSNARSQIPVLGNIPYLGMAFRRTIDNTVREEVIILLTPRIIRQELDEAVSEMLKDDVERFRVGQRKGLRWWGRNRIAQSHLRQAKQDLRNGRRGWALWHVDMALSLEPRMEEAIRLKERLTERTYWSDQSQYSAAKYVVQRMIMAELGKPVERVIPPRKPRDTGELGPDIRKAFGISPRIEDPLPGPQGEPAATPNWKLKSDSANTDDPLGGGDSKPAERPEEGPEARSPDEVTK